MLFNQIKPFIRFAAKTSYLPNKYFTVAYDNRLLYVIRGKGTFYFENRSYQISEGSLILYPCGIKYYPCSSVEDPLYFVTINYDFTQNNSNVKHLLPPVPVSRFSENEIIEKITFSDLKIFEEPIVLEEMKIVESYLLNVVDEFCYKKSHHPDITSGLMSVILGIVARYSTSNVKKSNIVDKILDYIHINFTNHIDNTSVAKEFNYHPYYINQLVKTQTGMSLHKYIVSYKINSALKLIMTTDMSIAEIAYKTGFKNPNHFSVCFKKETGKIPSYYKSRNNL